MIRKLIFVTLFLIFGVSLVLWLGAVTSLDHNRQHSATTAGLPKFDPLSADAVTLKLYQVEANGYVFRTRAAGFPGTAGNVILLHGFPETSIMFEATMETLAAAGFAVVAFDQRGYSPGARPEDVDAYTINHLVSDVRAVAREAGFDHYHLVGHDWGAAVGWTLVMEDAKLVDSWSALSIPHLTAYREAMLSDPDQQQRSGYINFFRTPWLPEILFSFNGFNLLKTSVYANHQDRVLEEYLRVFAEPGALTAALNWYRAGGLLTEDSSINPQLHIPVLLVWGTEDPVVGQRALADQQQYLLGPYREVALDTGHWLLQTRRETTIAAIVKHIRSVDQGSTDQSY
jgi:pimeloyl-ACP methyl ester carboxylesterase